MNYGVLSKGRSHLYDLAKGLENNGRLEYFETLWPRYKFPDLKKSVIRSHFYLYWIYMLTNNLSLEQTLLKLLSYRFMNSNKIIGDVNLAKYLPSKTNLYLDHPTDCMFYQRSQWEREEANLGFKIRRLARLNQYFQEEDIIELYEKSYKIIVPSESSRSTFHNDFKHKIKVAEFDLPQIPLIKETINKRKFEIGVGGIVCPSKGSHYLLEALKIIKFKGIVHMYGAIDNPAYKNYLDKEYRCIEIRFHGGLPQTEFYRRLVLMDMVVMPSVTEGLPLSCLQAVAMGVPVIGSSDSSLECVIGKNMIYDTYNIDDLASIIEKFISSGSFVHQINISNKKEYLGKWLKILE